ncbi:conserved hypothetical protein [Microsporum canis CBS 113480]|uniref:Uncharacterized protein n=1 Tax=Arthroderma otae (strain ATCC MYA-4605 / CBS 113480) TaxID=554155 RepID=C5FJ40_ARTOC|nr:conserved hypothetical protein [Microsporum canis CBS 113480]EEQ29370.1 conserved hypothetical protein [Microsporum canis CBS 113480]
MKTQVLLQNLLTEVLGGCFRLPMNRHQRTSITSGRCSPGLQTVVPLRDKTTLSPMGVYRQVFAHKTVAVSLTILNGDVRSFFDSPKCYGNSPSAAKDLLDPRIRRQTVVRNIRRKYRIWGEGKTKSIDLIVFSNEDVDCWKPLRFGSGLSPMDLDPTVNIEGAYGSRSGHLTITDAFGTPTALVITEDRFRFAPFHAPCYFLIGAGMWKTLLFSVPVALPSGTYAPLFSSRTARSRVSTFLSVHLNVQANSRKIFTLLQRYNDAVKFAQTSYSVACPLRIHSFPAEYLSTTLPTRPKDPTYQCYGILSAEYGKLDPRVLQKKMLRRFTGPIIHRLQFWVVE